MIKEYDGAVSAEELKQETSDGVVLVDFFSKTCGPCKMLSFVLKDIDKELGEQMKIVKVPFEENPELVKENGVEGYPTIILRKNGAEVARKAGLQQKPVIVNMIKEAL